jgi:uncharacterized protein involved in outer membrane biogenesis
VKRTIVALLVVGGIAVATLLLFVQFYSPEAQRLALERRLTDAFGAPAQIGTLKLTLSGGLGVEARDVRVALDPAFGEGTFLEVDEVIANVSVWHYLTTRELGIRSVDVTRPRIRFVKNREGVWNWSTLGSAPVSAKDERGNLPMLAFATPVMVAAETSSAQLERIVVSNAMVVLVDETAQPASVTEYQGLALDASLSNGSGERHATGRISGLSGESASEPLDIDVQFDVRMSRVGETARLRADGTIVSGRIATRNSRLDEISATITLDEAQRLVIPHLRLKLFGGDLEGSAAIELGTATNQFTIQGQVANLDLGAALSPKPELAGALHGIATASIQLRGELGDYAETLTSLEGEGRAEIQDAKIESVNILSEISKRANLTVIDFSETDTSSGNLTTDFRFERGSLRFSNAKASRVSGCVDLFVRDGRIGLGVSPQLDLVGTVTILPEIQQRVRADAPATQLLLAALTRGSGVTVPLRIRGPVERPEVELDLASLTRTLLFGGGAR